MGSVPALPFQKSFIRYHRQLPNNGEAKDKSDMVQTGQRFPNACKSIHADMPCRVFSGLARMKFAEQIFARFADRQLARTHQRNI